MIRRLILTAATAVAITIAAPSDAHAYGYDDEYDSGGEDGRDKLAVAGLIIIAGVAIAFYNEDR